MSSSPIFSHLILDKSSRSFPLPWFSPCTFSTFVSVPTLMRFLLSTAMKIYLQDSAQLSSLACTHLFTHSFFHSTSIYRMCALCWTQCSGDGQWEARSLPLRSLSLCGREDNDAHRVSQSAQAAVTKYIQHTVWLEQQTFLSHRSGSWKSKIKILWFAGESPLTRLQAGGSCWSRFWFSGSGVGPECSNVAERERELLCFLLFLGTDPIMELHIMSSSNYFTKAPPPNTRHQKLEFQRMNLEET